MERTQLFSYDSLNRLATAETLHQNQPWWQGDSPTAECWGEQFNYDPWGNLTGISPVSSAYTGCTQENWSMTATTKNQLQDTNNDHVYDAAGNLIQPGPIGGPYVFDAENHLTSAGGIAYLYDGDGKRVGKAPANTPTQPNYLYWYGTGFQILEETDGAGNYEYFNAYFNGMFLARSEPDNWVDHFFLDALGNVRSVYGDGDPDGGASDYYPFGGERPIPSCCPTNPGGVNVPFKFTGKERDSESGLDNFGARYDSSSIGRFMSADQLGPGQHPGNPQTWNLYSYVLNNPLKLVDPTGEFTCDAKTVSDQQCDNLQAGLDKAQEAADKLGETKGWDSNEYLAAQRAIDSYGDEGVDNGVVIAQGNTGNFAASTDPAGKAFPGEKLVVTFNTGNLDGRTDNLAVLAGHEGSHVADDMNWLTHGQSDSKWAGLGLSPGLPHTAYEFEQRAYSVGNSIAEGLGAPSVKYSFEDRTYNFPIPLTPAGQDRMEIMIKREYPNWNLSIFKSNTKPQR